MADELVFYSNPMSRGRIVRWMLEEVGAPYRTEMLDFGMTMKAPDYLAINPMGKVPAIRHGDAIVTECAAGPFEAAVINRSLGVEVPADKRGMVGYGSFAAVMDTMEQAVAGDGYIAGDRFSAADVYVGSHIGWGLQMVSIEARPGFAEYSARVSDREAYGRAMALDDAAMPVSSE